MLNILFFSAEVAQNAVRTLDIAHQKMTNPDFGIHHLKRCYNNIIFSEHAKKTYRTFFDYLLKNTHNNETLLFHCSEGKDRPGMASVFLLSALDFDFETIKQDYLLTNSATTNYLDQCLTTA